MPNGTKLTTEERGAIIALHGEGYALSAISKRVKRLSDVSDVSHRVQPDMECERLGTEINKLIKTAHRLLLREASKGTPSATQLVRSLNLQISPRRVQQILSASPNLCWTRMEKAFLLIRVGKQDSRKYTDTLQSFLLPFAASIYSNRGIFEQDNAAIHTSLDTKGCFLGNNLNVMKWSARSSDLNPFENISGVLARRVYNNGRQFERVTHLKVIGEENPIKTRPWTTLQACKMYVKPLCRSVEEAGRKDKLLNCSWCSCKESNMAFVD